MAQYAAGTKYPSTERAQAIEQAIHELGRELLKLQIAVKGQRVTSKKIPKKTKHFA